MNRSRRSVLLLAGLVGLSVLSCGREVTGPNDGLVYGRNRIASLNLAPDFPALPGANAASDLVPFTTVRVLLLRTDGTTAKDTLVDFPSTADSVALALDVPLPLTASDSGITLGLSMAYVNAQGDTVFRAGPQAITARPSGSSGGASPPITIPVRWVPPAGSPTPASVTLTPATGSAVAGSTTTLTAVARDAQGNALAGIPVGFSSLDTTRATFASVGSNVVSWKPKRGTALVVASLLNGPADTSAFDVALPAALLVPVSGAGQTALIGTALPQPIVWRVVASDSVPVAGVRVDFAVTTGGGTLGATADTSDANGLVSTPWTLGALVGAQRVTATLANASAATSAVTATGTAPISTQLAITSAPTTVVAGATMAPVTVEVRDAGGVLTPLFTGPVTIALNAGTTGATLGGTTTVNAVAGVATFSTLSIQQVATGLTLTATSGALASATSAAFGVTPAAASAIAIVSGNAQTGTLGQPLADSIVVRVADVFGNAVPGVTVTFSPVTFANSLSPSSAVTDTLGRAKARWTLGTSVGAHTARASIPSGPSVDFAATGVAGAAVKLRLFGDPLSVNAAGAPIAPAISFLAVDAVGAVATSFTTPVTLVFATNPTGATLGGRTTATPVNGVITFDSAWVSTVGTGYRFTTTGSGLPSDTTGGIVVVAGAPGVLASVSGDAQSGTVGTALAAPFVVRVTDAFGNSVAGQTVTWSVTSGTGTLSATTSTTNAAGEASTTLTLGATAGSATVTATAGTIGGSPQTFTATAVAGAATQLVLTSGTIGTQVAGVPLPDVTVEARDASGNRVTSFAGEVRALVTGTTPDSAFATAINGVATFSGAFFETAGTFTVTFTAPGLASATSNSFVVSPAAAATMLAQVALSLTGTAGLVLSPAPAVRIADAFDNAVPGRLVSFVLVRGADTLATTQVASDSAGIAPWAPTMPQTPGEVTIITRSDGLTNSPTSFSVTVSAGTAVQLEMVGQPISTTATTALNTISVRASDAFGNRNFNFAEQVTVAVDSGPAGAVLSGPTTLNALGGLATYSGLSLDKAGTYRLRFTSTGLTAAVSSDFTISAGAATTIAVLSGDAQTDTAGTVLPDSLVVRVTDAGGNVVSGVTTTWAIASGGGTVSPTSVTTDVNGRAAASWTLGAALGAQEATVTVGALTPVAFRATAVAGSNLVTWTGAVSSAWETAGNWDTGTLPTGTSPVVIPVGTPNDPVVSSPTTIGSLTVASEVTVTTNAILTVAGSVDVAQFSSVSGSDRLELVGTGTPTLRGSVGAVRVNGGTYALAGATSIAGNLEVYDGDLSVGNFDLAISGGLLTGLGGTFTMQGTGTVDVTGYVNFGGNSTAGRLTNGTMRVGGDFEQLDGGAGSPEQKAFVASGSHVVELVGTARQRVRFDSPDTTVAATCATSCFATLRANKPSGFIQFSNGVKALGDFDLVGADSISAPGRILVAGGAARLDAFLVRVGTIAWRDSLFVQGEGRVIDSLIAWGNGTRLTGVPNVRTVVRGDHRLSTTLQGIIDVTGSLDVDGRARVIGTLRTQGTGTLRMTDAGDTLQVDAEANFGGGSTEGLLSAGTLILGGSLVQAGDPRSFYASGTHTTVLSSLQTQSVSFTDRGGIGAFSHFQDLEVAKLAGGVELPNGAYVMGQLRDQTETALVFSAPSTQRLVVGGANLSNLRFDRVQLLIQNGATVEGLQDLTFGTFDAADIQLFIARNGGPVLLDGIIFETAPDTASGGAYLYLDDLADDGDTLTVTVSGVTPAVHGGAVQVQPDAVLTGWSVSAVATWISENLTDWFDGANWSTGVVPGATTDVVIPATASGPTMLSNTTVRSLTIQAGAVLGWDVGDTLTVTGNVVVDGAINPGGGFGALRLAPATSSTLSVVGSVGSVIEIASGTVQLADSVRAEGGNATGIRVTGGILDLNGHTMFVEGQFQTRNSGVLQMTSALDSLQVLGDITFAGGSEEGLLTNGEIRANGWFLQRSTVSQRSFAATGTHTVRFVGGFGSVNVEFDSPGTALSRFARLSLDQGSAELVRLVGFSAVAGDIVRMNSPLSVSGGTLTVSGTVAQPGANGTVQLAADGFMSLTGVNQATCDGRVFVVSGTAANFTPQTCLDAPAPTIVWTGAVNNSWGNIGNWNLNRLPTASDSVIIAVNDTVTVSTTANAAYITMGLSTGGRFEIASGAVLTVDSIATFGPTTTVAMTGGTLTGSAFVSVSGTLIWNGGVMSGTGSTFLNAGATGSVATSAGVTLDTRSLVLSGTATLGTGAINGVGVPSIVVNGGGILQFSGTRSYTLSTGEVDIVNAGTIRKTIDAGRVIIEWPITNLGTIIVQDDTLDLQGLLEQQSGLTQLLSGAVLIARGETQFAGNVAIADGARLQLQSGGVGANAGNHIFLPSSSISGQGWLSINSADTTRIQGAMNIDSLTVLNGNTWFEGPDTMFVANGAYLGGGFFRGNGVLGITGAFVLNAGNIVGTGTMSVRPTGTLTLRGMNGWKVDVAGKAIWGDYDMTFGQDTLNGIPYASMQVRSGGILEVAHGTITPRELFALGSPTPPNAVFTVDAGGTVRKISGTGVSNFRNRFLMSGVFDVQSGSINVQGTCAMSGSKTGSGQLTGNCGTF